MFQPGADQSCLEVGGGIFCRQFFYADRIDLPSFHKAQKNTGLALLLRNRLIFKKQAKWLFLKIHKHISKNVDKKVFFLARALEEGAFRKILVVIQPKDEVSNRGRRKGR